MRYIGNKTKLLPFILKRIRELGIPTGTAVDPFAGTASVARALKRAGWRVHAGDVMRLSYALQVARVALDRPPSFPADLPGLPPVASEPAPREAGDGDAGASGAGDPIPYRTLLRRLAALPGAHGFLTEHYTPAGAAGRRHGRMYFTPANARRLDAMRERIGAWSAAGAIDEGRAQLLIATLIEAADRVANTTGIYASFCKSWQPNARRDLELRPLSPTPPRNGGAPCTAFHGPAPALLEAVGSVDLAYLDPPYNGRQYPGYYHIPELLAAGWHPPPRLRGKTGLIPDDDRRSDWCRVGGAETALRTALERTDARHILVSYNDEGILEAGTIEAALRERGRADTYRRFTRGYKRYRSDADGPGRRYVRDRVREHLHYVRT